MIRNLIRGQPSRANHSRVHPDGVCHGEINQEPAVTHADGTDEKRNHHRSNRRAVRRDGSEDGELLQGQTITALTQEGSRSRRRKWMFRYRTLLNLPDGAGYTAKRWSGIGKRAKEWR